MEWQFRAENAKGALSAKSSFVNFLLDSCTPESDCESSLAVFGELVANVIMHAPGPIEITVQSDCAGVVTIDVYDTGDGFILAPTLPPPLSENGGRGLYIVSQLCSGLTLARVNAGNKVSAVLPVVAKPSHLHLVGERSGTAKQPRG